MQKKLQKIFKSIAKLPRYSQRIQVKIIYSEPVSIRKGGYGTKEKTEHILKLGLIRGAECLLSNRENSRSGWSIHSLIADPIHLNKIVDVEVFEPKKEEMSKEEFLQKEAQKVVNRIHPNLWDNLKEEYQEFIEKGSACYEGDWKDAPYALSNNGKAKFRSITSVFDEHVLREIKRAIENKTEYSHSKPTSSYSGRGRDRSVSMKMGDDGIFRAWFSSEYPGCGNGDYYYLINPTTALYVERD